MRKSVFNKSFLKFILFGCLAAAMMSCSGSSKDSGPFDGKWVVNSITCNGVAGNASTNFYITGGHTMTFDIADTTATLTFAGGGSTIVEQLAMAYVGTQVTMTVGSTSGGSAVMTGSPQVTAVLTGLDAMTLTMQTGSTWCSNSAPAQAEPSAFQLTLSP